jgi:NitT/TauT family transport system permease protein
MLKVLSIVAALIVWGLMSLTLPPEIFPGPIETTRVLWGEIAGGRVEMDVAMTMLRVVAGLLLAMIMGIPIGILMGLNRRAEAVLDVWVMVGLTVPSLCYAIMAFMWFGLNGTRRHRHRGHSRSLDHDQHLGGREGHRHEARRDGAGVRGLATGHRASRPPAANLSYVMASARFGLGIIWKITVLVELIGRPNGVGFKLFYWYQPADMRQVLAWTLLSPSSCS